MTGGGGHRASAAGGLINVNSQHRRNDTMTMQTRNRWVPVLAGLALLGAAPARTEEATATGPTFTGYVNTSYSYDLNDPLGGWTSLRSYDAKSGTFRLNSAHVAINGGLGDVKYTIETDAGTDATFTRDASFALVQANSFDIQEAYATFPDPILKLIGVSATVKAGKFVTFEGIEVIEPNANPTVTRGYLFGLAEPFAHVGVVITKPLGPVSLTVGAVNGWDKMLDNNDAPMGVINANIGLGEKVGMVNLTGYYGAETAAPGQHRNSFDLTSDLKFVPKVDLWIQANYGYEDSLPYHDAAWGGFALEPVISLSDTFSIGLRAEYFEDVGGSRTLVSDGAGGYISLAGTNFTIAPTWKFAKNAMMRWEYRMDSSNKQIYDSGKIDTTTGLGTPEDGTSTIAMDLTVTF